jgi:CRP-like cAMP-binding protein
VHTLYSGWAFRYKQLSDGRRQILAFVIPGDIVTPEMLCSGAYPVPFSIKTLTDVCLCSFEIKKFSGMMSSEAQAERLKQMEEHYVGAIYRRMTDIGRRSAAGRLAQLILELERRLSRRKLTRGKTFDFPLRQEHLADALGLTTVYVNRTLANFRKDGLIELSRQEMTILDIRTLQEVAEEG